MSAIKTTALLAAVVGAALGAPSASATPSGRPASIIFGRELPGGFELFRVHADGSSEQRLTRADGDIFHPDWSPDGKRIVFELDHADADPQLCSLVLIGPGGGGRTDLGAGEGCDYQPSFSPDGDHFVFGHFDEAAETERLMTMAADGSERRELDLPWKRGVDDPNYSPDGRWISFVRIKKLEKRQALFRVHPDGSRLQKLTPFRWEVAVKHDWSPDGRLIVLTTNADFVRPDAAANMVTIRPDGRLVSRVTDFDPGRNAFAGSFSPDSKRIVFRLEEGEKAGLATIRPDGSGLRRITKPSARPPRFIDWGSR